MSNYQQKLQSIQSNRKVCSIQRNKNKLTEIVTEEVQTLLNKAFKIIVLNMLKGPKENQKKKKIELMEIRKVTNKMRLLIKRENIKNHT